MCHASNVMGTFENDATKTLTTRSKYGKETVNTGGEGGQELAAGWIWHCRPITGTDGVWQQC